jgi:hypothetical protein
MKPFKLKRRKPKDIDVQRHYYADEFADIIGVETQPEFEAVIHLSMITALYKIADEFRDGEFRNEILELYGIK